MREFWYRQVIPRSVFPGVSAKTTPPCTQNLGTYHRIAPLQKTTKVSICITSQAFPTLIPGLFKSWQCIVLGAFIKLLRAEIVKTRLPLVDDMTYITASTISRYGTSSSTSRALQLGLNWMSRTIWKNFHHHSATRKDQGALKWRICGSRSS